MSEFTLVEAANGGKPKVAGIAYSGGKMNLPGWQYPVVVELSGMVIPESVPLLTDHDNRTGCRVGMITAAIRENALEISGEILADTEEAGNIVAQSKAGADWQLSIGADVKDSELVKSGERAVNGRMVEAPFYHVKASVLREVSVVAVGADVSTRMKVTAHFNLTMQGEQQIMATEPKNEQNVKTPEPEQVKPQPEAPAPAEKKGDPAAGAEAEAKAAAPEPEIKAMPDVGAIAKEASQAAVKAERERVGAIQSICNGEFPEIEKQAISAGWSPDETTRNVLSAIRANRPGAGVAIVVKDKPEGHEARKTLEAALGLRAGIDIDVLAKDYGERAVEAGMGEMDMPLKQVVAECLRIDGISAGRGFDNGTIRAAFSSVTLPGILSNIANKKLLQSYTAQPVIATTLCSTGDLSDFKENDRFRLTDVGDLLPIAADGEIKEGGLVEESAKNQLDTYGKKFCLTRKMIINDDLNAFMKVPAAMGNRAARLIDQLFFSRLLSNPVQGDSKRLFSPEHRNLLTGDDSALSADSLKLAIQRFLDQVDADGQPISVEPRYLLVPTALKHLAIELTKGATLIMAGGDDVRIRPALNVLADENLRVVSSPYLNNAAYEGHSPHSWYLFGDPKEVDTWEIGFLKGKRTPTIEQGETDFNTLGMWFRVYFDIGVREQDHRGMVKANGEG